MSITAVRFIRPVFTVIFTVTDVLWSSNTAIYVATFHQA